MRASKFGGCRLFPRQISGRRVACPPARRPRRELRLVRRLEARPGPAGLAAASNRSGCLCVARPGPAAAHGHRSQALPPPTGTAARPCRRPRAPRPAIVTCPRVLARRHSNFACNSRLAISNFEFISLELQRFQTLLKVHAIELHAILLSAGPVAHGHCGQAPPPPTGTAARPCRLSLIHI